MISNAQFAEKMKDRTKQYALRGIGFFRLLPDSVEVTIIGKQMLRAVTSVAAIYRAACRALSNREFYAKLSIIVEELDESLFRLDLLTDAGIFEKAQFENLISEGGPF